LCRFSLDKMKKSAFCTRTQTSSDEEPVPYFWTPQKRQGLRRLSFGVFNRMSVLGSFMKRAAFVQSSSRMVSTMKKRRQTYAIDGSDQRNN